MGGSWFLPFYLLYLGIIKKKVMATFKSKGSHSTVTVTVKTGVLVDDYKIQQYVAELSELINNHIKKGLV